MEANSNEYLTALINNRNVEITRTDEPVNISDKKYIPIALSNGDKMRLNGLIQAIPASQAFAQSLNTVQYYTLRFPSGLPHTLMQLKNGMGYTTSIMGSNGILGTAALVPAISPLGTLSLLSTISSISNALALSQIADSLDIVKMKIDSILEFLYGDKKAELLAEIDFVKSSFINYKSISNHPEQRSAIISSLHESRKIAMKDIEFYLNDIFVAIEFKNKNASELNEAMIKILNITDTLKMSIQLYATSYLLEAYYSENSDSSFIDYIKSSTQEYIKKCNGRVSSCYNRLDQEIANHDKNKALTKAFTGSLNRDLCKKISEISAKLSDGANLFNDSNIDNALSAFTDESNYLVDNRGNIFYIRKVI